MPATSRVRKIMQWRDYAHPHNTPKRGGPTSKRQSATEPVGPTQCKSRNARPVDADAVSAPRTPSTVLVVRHVERTHPAFHDHAPHCVGPDARHALRAFLLARTQGWRLGLQCVELRHVLHRNFGYTTGKLMPGIDAF